MDFYRNVLSFDIGEPRSDFRSFTTVFLQGQRVKRPRPQRRERLFNRDRYKREGPSPLDARSTITIIPAPQGAYDRRATRRKNVLAH